MKERPILFSGPMVRELLAGRKTQTRRPVKAFASDPGAAMLLRMEGAVATFGHSIPDDPVPLEVRCPYGAPGDRLWVREAFSLERRHVYPCPPAWYRADLSDHELRPPCRGRGLRRGDRRVRLDLDLYLRVRARLAELGYGGDVEWAQSVKAPKDAIAFACEYVWVVLNSGMKNTIARKIMDRVWPRLAADEPIADVFGHAGKREALETVWRQREWFFRQFQEATDPVAWCETLPWIGGITKWHLAKNLGVDCAKPDRWLVRLAEIEGETVDPLCRRLARASGDRIATVDVVLWRACAVGVLVIREGGLAFAEGRSVA